MCGNKLDSKYKRRGTAGLCGSWQTEASCPGGLECDLGCVAGVGTPFFAAVGGGSASGPLGAQLVLSSTPGLFVGMSLHRAQFSCWLKRRNSAISKSVFKSLDRFGRC